MKHLTHKIVVTLYFSLILSFSVNAQDSIIKRDGSELNVKITEISETELKYQKSGLDVLFSINIGDVLLVTFENGERMTFENAKNDDSSKSKFITAGTRIPLIVNETISSDNKGGRRVSVGEVITLTVQLDITDVDGNVLVKQGTLVNGTITKSVKRKAAGTKGKLGFNVAFVKAADGQSIPVDLKYDSEGKSRTAVAVATGAIVAAPLLLIHGKPAVIQSGDVFNAIVLGDKKITTNSRISFDEINQLSIDRSDSNNDFDLDSGGENPSVKDVSIVSENAEPGIYYNGNNCLIDKEISLTDVKIKCLNETGRAYDKFTVNKSQLIFHEITHEWQITSNLTNSEVNNVGNKSPGLYYNGAFCKILEDMPDGYVRIKHLNETGRAYYKKVVLRSELVEVK